MWDGKCGGTEGDGGAWSLCSRSLRGRSGGANNLSHGCRGDDSGNRRSFTGRDGRSTLGRNSRCLTRVTRAVCTGCVLSRGRGSSRALATSGRGSHGAALSGLWNLAAASNTSRSTTRWGGRSRVQGNVRRAVIDDAGVLGDVFSADADEVLKGLADFVIATTAS